MYILVGMKTKIFLQLFGTRASTGRHPVILQFSQHDKGKVSKITADSNDTHFQGWYIVPKRFVFKRDESTQCYDGFIVDRNSCDRGSTLLKQFQKMYQNYIGIIRTFIK